MDLPCITCKGKTPMQSCGRTHCPIVLKNSSLTKVQGKIKESFQGQSPTPFIGHHNYPNLNVGILSPHEHKENAWEYDAPRHWAESNTSMEKIIDYRSALVNSRFQMNVKAKNKFLEISQEIGMASKPVDLEINLGDKPFFNLNIDPFNAPTGPNAKLKQAKITENTKVDTRVEKVVDDTDLKATDAIDYLYQREFDEHFLTKLISIGNIGVKKDRKIVPTRWSITAVDDMLGKALIKQIKNYNDTDYLAYFGNYMGNYFLIMFIPDVWSYELFETYAPNAEWNPTNEFKFTTDNETYQGRKYYAHNTAGGYYANRLPILEKLMHLKRQATVLTLRFISAEYPVPLGVWVVREATRKTLENRPIEFGNLDLMIKYAKNIIKKKFGYDIQHILDQSITLKNLKTQSKLTKFLPKA